MIEHDSHPVLELSASELEEVGGGMRLDDFDNDIEVYDQARFLNRGSGPLRGGYVRS